MEPFEERCPTLAELCERAAAMREVARGQRALACAMRAENAALVRRYAVHGDRAPATGPPPDARAP